MARADQRSCKLLHHPATERGLNLYHSLGAADRANCGGPTEPNTHSVIQGAREAILHVQPRSRLQTPLRLPKLPQRTLRFLIVSRLNFAHGADFSLHFAHASPSFLPALDGCKPAEEPANPSESSIPPREPKISRPIITAQAKTHQNIVERPPWTAPQKHPKVEQFGQSAEQRFRGDESEFVAVCISAVAIALSSHLVKNVASYSALRHEAARGTPFHAVGCFSVTTSVVGVGTILDHNPKWHEGSVLVAGNFNGFALR